MGVLGGGTGYGSLATLDNASVRASARRRKCELRRDHTRLWWAIERRHVVDDELLQH